MEFTKEQIEEKRNQMIEVLNRDKHYMSEEMYKDFVDSLTDEYIISLLKYDEVETPEYEYSDDIVYTSREEALRIYKDLEEKGYSSSDDGFKFE